MSTHGPNMSEYSVFSLLKHTLSGHKNWKETWRSPAPKSHYDIIIVGGGGHGLATAYYLAKEHNLTNIAVLEKGWIGGGNMGRNTTIVRSNYMLEANTRFYEHSLKLWESLSQELNYNVMFSQRGVINLAHTPAQLDGFARRGNAMLLNGADAELLDRDEIARRCPGLDMSPDARFPIVGGMCQPRGGTARHDAVAWGYAHGADRLGVDIIENCEVTGFQMKDAQVCGVETTRGAITAGKVGVAVAGHTSQVMQKAGLERLPIESHLLQAFVSEPVKPLIDTVVTFGAGHLYISQSNKGGLVFGGDIDGYNSFAQRGNMPVIEDVAACAMTMFPNLGKIRLLRHWGGIMDMSMDGTPIISETPIQNLYLNGGWCYGGFKATPASGWCFAHLLATGTPHDLIKDFTLNRFERGYTIDEKGVGAQPRLH